MLDMRLSVIKPLSAKWTIKAVDEVASRPCDIKKGFERAGILEYVYPLRTVVTFIVTVMNSVNCCIVISSTYV